MFALADWRAPADYFNSPIVLLYIALLRRLSLRGDRWVTSNTLSRRSAIIREFRTRVERPEGERSSINELVPPYLALGRFLFAKTGRSAMRGKSTTIKINIEYTLFIGWNFESRLAARRFFLISFYKKDFHKIPRRSVTLCFRTAFYVEASKRRIRETVAIFRRASRARRVRDRKDREH